MKKKIVALVILLSAVLAGCGNNESVSEQGNDAFKMAKVSCVGTGSQVMAGAAAGAISEEKSTVEEFYANFAVENISINTEENTDASKDMVADKTTMNNSVDGRELPIYCIDTEEKKIALSFDAAWGNEDTKEILEILGKHNIHATFFMTGEWVENYPEDVKTILAAGHDLGNHSENHLNMSQLSDEEKEKELMAVHKKVQELTGYEMFLFRPPYGDYDNAVVNVAKNCNYYTIQWDVDSLDWENEGVDAIIQTVIEHKNLGNGSIILCHNGAEYTAQALDNLLTNLEGQGYTIVPVSELIYKDNYHLNHEGRQIRD